MLHDSKIRVSGHRECLKGSTSKDVTTLVRMMPDDEQEKSQKQVLCLEKQVLCLVAVVRRRVRKNAE